MSQGNNFRLIARLDIKGNNVIKGVNLEGLRVVGSPIELAYKYYKQGVDELLFMDCVASLYGRNQLTQIISDAAENIFIPITVGGGIRSVSDVNAALRAGADKVAINTAAVANPSLLSEVAKYFGSQCLVLSVEAKQVGLRNWEVYTDNGREPSGMDVITWVKQAVQLGVGEILLTSIDYEGTRKGFDLDLIKAVSEVVAVPVIASGGMGKIEDIISVSQDNFADAAAMADILHYNRNTLPEIRDVAILANINVRSYETN